MNFNLGNLSGMKQGPKRLDLDKWQMCELELGAFVWNGIWAKILDLYKWYM